MAKTSWHWHGIICGSLQFECSSVTMGTQDCELMYSKLRITVWRIRSMQKFHSKMTPHSLRTKFPLTEITYAKVCISYHSGNQHDLSRHRSANANCDQLVYRQLGHDRRHHRRFLHPVPVPGCPSAAVGFAGLHVQALPIRAGRTDWTVDTTRLAKMVTPFQLVCLWSSPSDPPLPISPFLPLITRISTGFPVSSDTSVNHFVSWATCDNTEKYVSHSIESSASNLRCV